MNTVLIYGLSEALLALAFIAGLIFFKSRERRRRHADFEKLLDDIKDRQDLRAKKLVRHMIGNQQFDQADAEKLSADLIEAEKLFLQKFITQQLQQQPVADFYENLCQLLDSYLDSAIPPNGLEQSSVDQEHPLANEQAANNQNATAVDQPPSPDEPPTWGDVFD